MTSLQPGSATAGGATLTLTITGMDFVNTSVVRWNGSERATTYLRSTVLQASVPAMDLVSSGTESVTVFNPTPGSGESNALTFTISKANQTINFGPLTDTTIGSPPFTITATATSGLPVTFTAAPGSVCTVSGNTVTPLGLGTCTITAHQSGNATYNPALDVLQASKVLVRLFLPLIRR